ncbi:hypothetical protein E2C01_013174 [Portunus trituberculatus]|uniref:Uncharacterized protein n=1 Tax=Portunus trituberculatus TaxID=210409 RepID=A0A5B7DGD9_PORTR|nr:hypothetical protein [Portunus trituberculatus]
MAIVQSGDVIALPSAPTPEAGQEGGHGAPSPPTAGAGRDTGGQKVGWGVSSYRGIFEAGADAAPYLVTRCNIRAKSIRVRPLTAPTTTWTLYA